MIDLIELAKRQADEIAQAGHNGWGNAMAALDEALEAARVEEERLKMRLLRPGVTPKFRPGVTPKFRPGVTPKFRPGVTPKFSGDAKRHPLKRVALIRNIANPTTF